jgi:serine/threonine-protein kinase
VEPNGAPDPALGSEVAGYRIEAQIGQGGMSRVYRAQDLRLGRPVALKLLGSELANDPLFRTRFEREWRLAAALRHPHIIPIYNAGDDGGTLYIAMLLVDGGDLSSTLRHVGAMEPDYALDLLAQVASALHAAHRQDLIHRDLKPSNVLLETGRGADGADHAYLADFGLTKSVAVASELTQAGLYLGTPNYSAPEQIEGRTVDSRADVYALGCMLFECLTGSVPFPRENEMAAIAAHLTESPPSASARRPGLPAGLDAVLARALAKSPDARYSTAPELIAAARGVVRAANAASTVALPPAESPYRVESLPEIEAAPTSELQGLVPPRRTEPLPASPRHREPSTLAAGRALGFDEALPKASTAPDPSSLATRFDQRPRVRKPRRRRISFALLGPLAGIVAVPLIVGGVLLSGALSGVPAGPTGSPPGVGSIIGSSSSIVLASASPSAPSSPYFEGATADERFLVHAVPAAFAGDCGRGEHRPSDVDVQGDVAAIDCRVDDPDVTEARYFRFVATAELLDWWQERLRAESLQPDSAGCAGGRQGETSYDQGRLLCFASSGQARLRWIDEERLIYGVVNARTPEIEATFQWWLDSHQTAGVSTQPRFQPVEQALVDEAPDDIVSACIPYRVVAKNETVVEGSLGAIDCIVNSKLIEDVGYFEFPTRSALREWWKRRVASMTVAPSSGGCVDGTSGETSTAIGRVACYVTGGVARIRWTDEDRLVYGTLNGRTTEQARLFAWWDARH